MNLQQYILDNCNTHVEMTLKNFFFVFGEHAFYSITV